MIPTEVKATPIILLKLRRQLLALCISQSFDTRVTEQKHIPYNCWNRAHNYANTNKLTFHYLLCCEIVIP